MSRQGRKSANSTIYFFKPASLGIHSVQARDESRAPARTSWNERQSEVCYRWKCHISPFSVASGVVPTAGDRFLPLWCLKGLRQTTDSSADFTRLGGAILPHGPPLFLKLKPKQKPKLKGGAAAGVGLGSAAGGVLVVAEPSGNCSLHRRVCTTAAAALVLSELHPPPPPAGPRDLGLCFSCPGD